MIFSELVEKLSDRRVNLSEVAKNVGLSRYTLHKIVNGTQKSIKIENLVKLEDYFATNSRAV